MPARTDVQRAKSVSSRTGMQSVRRGRSQTSFRRNGSHFAWDEEVLLADLGRTTAHGGRPVGDEAERLLQCFVDPEGVGVEGVDDEA